MHARWMKPLVQNICFVMQDLVGLMEQALELTQDADGPAMYEKAIQSDLQKYQSIADCTGFMALYESLTNLTYDRLASSRGFEGNTEKLEQVKKLRDMAKDAVKKINRQYFFCSPQTMAEQLRRTGPMTEELVRVTVQFAERFAEEKRKKNLVDFHDLEHFALQILVDEKTKQARAAAEEFRDTFEEIMIDEYQDSNQVQETILRSISKEERGQNNIFMVGDVKQSIYRFRLARPELFMEKYDTYSLTDSTRQRIDLHKNFRSRHEVLDFTNDIFYKIMAKNLGNVEYDEEAALYTGADYREPQEELFAPEILLLDEDEALFSEEETGDKRQLEARMIAAKIKKMMESQLVTDRETGQLVPIKYSDIVILLRSLSGWADRFAAVLGDCGIPAYTVSATGYFSAVEVQTVLSMLRILDNPRQDIPFTAVLRSPMVGLTDEELATIRLRNREVRFHVCVLEFCEEISQKDVSETDLCRKLSRFYDSYKSLRNLVPDTPIHELIQLVLEQTGYGDYVAAMPAGKRRKANLEMLIEKALAYENTSYKGLFHFVRYIDELQKYDVDFGEADIVGENENVVRIMSIHKSKGLEFPVVFVCGMGKNFNRQDVRSRMVLHPELGMGLDYMDGERRIKSPTIAKKAIARQIDMENLGEELRVLYVALTRAKEKLILTGTKKQAREFVNAQAQIAALSQAGNRSPLPYMARESASGYLDWIVPAVLSYGKRYPVTVIEAAKLVTEEVQEQMSRQWDKEKCMEIIRHANRAQVAKIDEVFSRGYAHGADIVRKNKYSVSELKHRAMRGKLEQEEDELVPVFKNEEIVPYVPGFVRELNHEEAEVNQGALRGTAVHRVMECYQFSSEVSAAEQIEQMLMNQLITAEMKELVSLPLVERFVASETGARMKLAQQRGELYREKPFVMGFTEEELRRFGFGDEDNSSQNQTQQGDLTLIQGIIDVFWMEEDGIVILDYKTDRIGHAKELTDRYSAQLKLYAEALERIYHKSGQPERMVKEKLLYSFRLQEVILVQD